MARPAVISEAVIQAAIQIAADLPLDMCGVTLDAILNHGTIVSKGYTRIQVGCALGQLERAGRVVAIEDEKHTYKIPTQPQPLAKLAMPRGSERLKLSSEGVFYLQMNHLICSTNRVAA